MINNLFYLGFCQIKCTFYCLFFFVEYPNDDWINIIHKILSRYCCLLFWKCYVLILNHRTSGRKLKIILYIVFYDLHNQILIHFLEVMLLFLVDSQYNISPNSAIVWTQGGKEYRGKYRSHLGVQSLYIQLGTLQQMCQVMFLTYAIQVNKRRVWWKSLEKFCFSLMSRGWPISLRSNQISTF